MAIGKPRFRKFNQTLPTGNRQVPKEFSRLDTGGFTWQPKFTALNL